MEFSQKYSSFAARIPDNAGKDLKTGISTAVSILHDFQRETLSIKSDTRYSAAGQAQEVAKALSAGPLKRIGQLHADVSRRLDVVRGQRAALVPKAPDPATAADRREIRDFLRSLPEGERLRFAVETKEFREAIASAPAALSGVSEEIKGRVVAAIVEEQFGPRVQELGDAEAMLATAEMALGESLADARRVAGEEAMFAAGKAA